jgi:hypothetical protein
MKRGFYRPTVLLIFLFTTALVIDGCSHQKAASKKPVISVVSGLNNEHRHNGPPESDVVIKVNVPSNTTFLAQAFEDGMVLNTYKADKNHQVTVSDQVGESREKMKLYALKKDPGWDVNSSQLKHPIAVLTYTLVPSKTSFSNQDLALSTSSDGSSSSWSKASSSSFVGSSSPSNPSFDYSQYADIHTKFSDYSILSHPASALFGGSYALKRYYVTSIGADSFHEYHMLLAKDETAEPVFLMVFKPRKKQKFSEGTFINAYGTLNGIGAVNSSQIGSGISPQYSGDKVVLFMPDRVEQSN